MGEHRDAAGRADEAHRIGLVNRVVADGDLDAEAMALAQRIASKPPATVALGKAAFQRLRALPLDEAYADASETMACNLEMPEAQEGIGAFLEKRAPRWSAT